MIHTNDLMLGNYVVFRVGGKDSDKRSIPMQVVGIFGDTVHLDFDGNEGDVWEEKDENLFGIEITEELLDKIEVAKNVHECMESSNGKLLYVGKSNDEFSFSVDCMPCFNVTYLHQLQNAYHLLTGKDLEVRL